jgi:metal-responsive CopG/Arc/MetJ family transcriptional regulator
MADKKAKPAEKRSAAAAVLEQACIPVSFKIENTILRSIDEISRRECRTRTGTVKLALRAFIETDGQR